MCNTGIKVGDGYMPNPMDSHTRALTLEGMEERKVDKSTEVDIIECCMIDRLSSTHKTLRFDFRGPAFPPSIRGISLMRLSLWIR